MLVKGIGYAASFEQFDPNDMLTWSQQAEQQGFISVIASDHFHPWVPSQGQSAFVWSWMGALGATTKLRFGTGVTPPGYRYHPAILAQAAATLEAMFPGRFYLGLGAGEALNEHIIGDYWPEAPVRLERLAESIEIIKQLFTGKVVKYRCTALQRRKRQALHAAASTPPPIYVATAGPIQAKRTGRTCDGLITVGAADDKLKMLMSRFEEGAKEAGKDPATMPKIIQFKVSLRRHRGGGHRAGDQGMAERRHVLPEGRYPQPRGLRGDGQAGPPGALQEPGPDLAESRRAHQA